MKKIFFKIFGGFVLLILILSVLFLTFSFSMIRSYYQKTTAQELEILGREMSHEILAYLEKGEKRGIGCLSKKARQRYPCSGYGGRLPGSRRSRLRKESSDHGKPQV